MSWVSTIMLFLIPCHAPGLLRFSSYFAENYIYLFNNGVDSNSTAAATNGITWVFRDDGYVSSKYATNTDLYPQSAFSNFYGYPVAGEWTVEFTNDNAAEAKVDKICLYFNGAEPA